MVSKRCQTEVATMSHPRISDAEIDQRGQKLYEERIRSLVEKPENIGKQIVIDVETGDFELEEDGWHVDYELKDPRLKGGGPHYVIDRFNGAILSKRYEQ